MHVQHTFLIAKNNFARFCCTFLCRCSARLQREIYRNVLVTRFMEEMWYVFLFTFFCCRSFSPWWQQAFRLFLTAAIKFLCSNQMGLLPWFQRFFVIFLRERDSLSPLRGLLLISFAKKNQEKPLEPGDAETRGCLNSKCKISFQLT